VTDSYELFKKQILGMTGIDLGAYKENQMRRRIDSLITKCGICSYFEYASLLRKDREKYEEFINYLTINVSEFWRNPEQWEVLEKLVIPTLIKNDTVRIWSAACSTGDEPYSAVMLLKKYIPTERIKLIATDIDKQVLQKARSGIYCEKSLKGLPNDLKRHNFTDLGNGTYEIHGDVKKCVTFREHDLLKDPYPLGQDIIICRNVLIYFTDETKNRIYERFNKSLIKGGHLFLGSTEQILYPAEFGFASVSSFFYKKL